MYSDVAVELTTPLLASKKDNIHDEIVLNWSHIDVHCRSERTWTNWFRQEQSEPERILLNDISGIARPGQILAIMGASGVGKTTLLKVLSGQDDPRTTVTTGDVLLDGHVATRSQRLHNSIIGHVEQQELFIETMSTEEHLIFQVCPTRIIIIIMFVFI
jgi:ABC-type multidrug transport system ATPase subunit